MDSSTGFGTLNYVVLFTYLSFMVGVGISFAGKQKTLEDYFLAGRNMPWAVVGISMFVSVLSAVSYVGVPGVAYEDNIALLVEVFVSPVCVPILIFVFYPFYRILNVTTSYEYVLQRFGKSARFMVSALFVLGRGGWLGAVIYAPAMVLSSITDLPIWLLIILMGVLATTYTALGGLSAVLWTDVVQFLILFGGAVWVAFTLTTSVPGGFASIWEIAEAANHIRVIDWEINLAEMTGIAVLLSYFLQLVYDYGADQITVQRVLAAGTSGGMARATISMTIAQVLTLTLLLYVGLGLFAYFQTFPSELGAGIGGDRVLPYYIMNTFPAGFSGLLIAALFAAAMSSMDSGINSITSVLITDFIRPLRAKEHSERHDVRLSRYLTIFLGALATGVAFSITGIEQILKASNAFLGLFGSPILALFLLGMLTRRGNFRGWLVGMIAGISITAWCQQTTDMHWIYYFPLCFIISFGIGTAASLLLGVKRGGPLGRPELTLWGRQW